MNEAPSTREWEVLQLVWQGKGSRQIASALGLSAKTVETHRSNVMRKLRLRTAADLVRYAERHAVVEFLRSQAQTRPGRGDALSRMADLIEAGAHEPAAADPAVVYMNQVAS